MLDLQYMFNHLVDLTEPIWRQIDRQNVYMLFFGISGGEALVTENNSKYTNRIIKQLKTFKKANGMNDSYDPYIVTYIPCLPTLPPKPRQACDA